MAQEAVASVVDLTEAALAEDAAAASEEAPTEAVDSAADITATTDITIIIDITACPFSSVLEDLITDTAVDVLAVYSD